MNQKIRPIGPDSVHVCVDMQRIIAEQTAWQTPSIPAILPASNAPVSVAKVTRSKNSTHSLPWSSARRMGA